MSTYIESQLQQIIAFAEENRKISSEYSFKLFKIFLTAAEAREILEILTRRQDDYDVVHSTAATR
jgi:hypothetical protein